MLRLLKSASFVIISCLLFSCSDSESDDSKTEKKPKLTSEEVELVRSVEDDMEFKFFITGQIPEELIKLEAELKELMEEIHQHNPKIKFLFIDPYSMEEIARENFMKDLYVNKRIPFINVTQRIDGIMTQKYVFTEGLISYQDVEHSFSLIKVSEHPVDEEVAIASGNSVKNCKRNILRQIKRILAGKPIRMAFLTGHGEAKGSQTFIIEREMSEFYWVNRINLKNEKGQFDLHALDHIDGLIICRPREVFAPQELLIIDQFIMRGGKTIWMIDPVNVDEQVLQTKGETIALANDFGLDDMLFQYGVRFNEGLLLTESCGPLGISPEPNVINWCYFPLIIPDSGFDSHQSVFPIKLEYCGTLDFIGPTEHVKKTNLLVAGKKSKIVNAPVRVNLKTVNADDIFDHAVNANYEIAFLLEGKFNSTIKSNVGVEDFQMAEADLKDRSVHTKMMFVADGGLIINDTTSSFNSKSGKYETACLKLEADKYNLRNPDGSLKFKYGNLEFFMDALYEMMYE